MRFCVASLETNRNENAAIISVTYKTQAASRDIRINGWYITDTKETVRIHLRLRISYTPCRYGSVIYFVLISHYEQNEIEKHLERTLNSGKYLQKLETSK